MDPSSLPIPPDFPTIPPTVVNQIINRIDTVLQSSGEGVFMKVTADQLLFKGWPLKPYIDLY